MCDVDVTVIGGGVVGCAAAVEVCRRGFSTVLLERAARLGAGTTSRNSEVAHGGMYYPAGSQKAQLCARGRRQMKTFCEASGVPYQECGKLIVAVTGAEEPELERLLELGRQNDVEDLRLLGRAELLRLEPRIEAVAALFSPRTGIFAAEEAARALGQQASEQGAQVFTGADCVGLRRRQDGWRVAVAPPAAGGGVEAWSHSSRIVVNAAGLYADRIARLAGVDVAARGWRLQWVKGNYFAIAPAHDGAVTRLIYPVPPDDGTSLGVHLCLDLAGQMRIGPDVEPLGPSAGLDTAGEASSPEAYGSEDYSVDEARGDRFFASAARYLPWLGREDLTPAMAGIRPRLAASGFSDWVIAGEDESDLAGLVNLIAIDSPGLTAAIAIAEEVGALVADRS